LKKLIAKLVEDEIEIKELDGSVEKPE